MESDVLEECEKLGEVIRIRIFEFNPEGVVEVKFKEAVAAQECIDLMNGRNYGGKTVECFFWDGVVDYKIIRESEES